MQEKIGLINFLGVGYVPEDTAIQVLKLAHLMVRVEVAASARTTLSVSS